MRTWLSIACLGLPACKPGMPLRAEDSTAECQAMVESQIAGRGVRDSRVLDAMRAVPRHEFVPANLRTRAYEDNPLPIGYEQTISQPYIVAFMTEQLASQPTHRVLEIGTGSGYQAAILGELVHEVYSIEIVRPLGEEAAQRLTRLGYANVSVRVGNGYLGWPERAPFDAIIVTCAPESVPQPLIDQLKPGGRMCIPVGPTAGVQELYLMSKRADGTLERNAILSVRFVQMTGKKS